MIETLKSRTGQSLSERLDLYQLYLDGCMTYEEYERRCLATERPQVPSHADQTVAAGVAAAGSLIGAAAYSVWRQITQH